MLPPARGQGLIPGAISRLTTWRRPPGRIIRRPDRLVVGSDTKLNELTADLVAEGATFSAPMPELDCTGAQFRSANLQRSRDPGGHAQR